MTTCGSLERGAALPKIPLQSLTAAMLLLDQQLSDKLYQIVAHHLSKTLDIAYLEHIGETL
jgi:hypothetical protein